MLTVYAATKPNKVEQATITDDCFAALSSKVETLTYMKQRAEEIASVRLSELNDLFQDNNNSFIYPLFKIKLD